MATLYYDTIHFSEKELYFAATDVGLVYIGTQEEQIQSAKFAPEKMTLYKEEIRAYLNGERTQFTVPIDLAATPLQLEVFNALQAIPYGETRTYTEIAEQINRPKAVRAVGTAIGKNPLLLVIPCHRVIGKNGKLTGYSGGIAMKEALLTLEK
ncbi:MULTISPECIES: methylated-DNA--[protein]-cysteine S-methyltransferase [Listeria]|uniref:methylated-DNA--[protein]-cysteine S-methyltransferase n=2 Tax=Listeria marthii TaxID=529731 RepID=A0A842CT60_9LIST|nr:MULTISPECIES: methylated-DNA--[protein]-cysteine S-methyltransferase [Listeria]EFR86931.1 methylated-DNA--protein-cysteinemethyltransferase [Listeria marthii FSL S4-120]MBC1979343.1 methylated-DNA--[protein]-cysteine S-methyltransferase [Listeria marthii]MBC2013162.1 methylated-DNA--[protein]-cysteine S-methyltransferase [Listeria marthii]MBC2072655.1 methylated-DNA--[protein]-cysteine S-methyltransferase [Listeria marthii]MBC2074971.1 methylated-DNA--[protein]-cysteine S-methyltransferase 